MALKRIYTFLADESGASAAEFALVLPLFLVLIFGAIASGVFMYTTISLQRATEISARCLSAQRTDCSLADISTFALPQYGGPDLAGLAFNASNSDATCDGYLVTASGSFNWFAGTSVLSVPFGASACYPGPY